MMRNNLEMSFVTIRIFARTELAMVADDINICFVTIRIFARTVLLRFGERRGECFVTIRIFAGTDLKKEKGSVPPPEPAEGHSHLHFIV